MWKEYFKCAYCQTKYYMYKEGKAAIVYYGEVGCLHCEPDIDKIKEEYQQIDYSHWIYKKGFGWETVQDNAN
jgi:hypothetical protein